MDNKFTFIKHCPEVDTVTVVLYDANNKTAVEFWPPNRNNSYSIDFTFSGEEVFYRFISADTASGAKVNGGYAGKQKFLNNGNFYFSGTETNTSGWSGEMILYIANGDVTADFLNLSKEDNTLCMSVVDCFRRCDAYDVDRSIVKAELRAILDKVDSFKRVTSISSEAVNVGHIFGVFVNIGQIESALTDE
jgi:hypothetical protein